MADDHQRPAGPPELRNYTVTVPAGTTAAAPLVQNLAMPPRRVLAIRWRVPTGPMGSLGWQLSMGKVQVLPTPGTDQWLVANGETGTWHVSDLPDSGSWQLTAYNTGSLPHSVYLEFTVDLIRGLSEADLAPRLLIHDAALGAS